MQKLLRKMRAAVAGGRMKDAIYMAVLALCFFLSGERESELRLRLEDERAFSESLAQEATGPGLTPQQEARRLLLSGRGADARAGGDVQGFATDIGRTIAHLCAMVTSGVG